MSELETRSFEIRSIDDDKREVVGLAVPFDQVIEVGGIKEKFVRGSINSHEGLKLHWNHDPNEVIGMVTGGEGTEHGYQVTASLSRTARGNDVYVLLKDGVVDKFSVAFYPQETRKEDGVFVRTKVRLGEVSLVPYPAYAGASVTEIRSAQKETVHETETTSQGEAIMTDNTEVAELRGTVEELERRMATFNTAPVEAGSQFRSLGEVVKGLAANDENARAELRAFTGSTIGENISPEPHAWIEGNLRLIEDQRKVGGLFTRRALPATGNVINYPTIAGISGAVAVQANEGDDLSMVKVSFGSNNTSVQTVGAYASLSRQMIERTDLPTLETHLSHLVREYGRQSERTVVGALTGATGTHTLSLGATPTAVQWVSLVVDAAGAIEDAGRGAAAEFIVCSRDVYRKLVNVTDTTGRPAFVVNGDGVNSVGNVNVRGLSANVAGLPVVVGALPNNSLFVASSSAITHFTDGPTSLQDENIINLTRDFSVYGYEAVAVVDNKALVKVTVGA